MKKLVFLLIFLIFLSSCSKNILSTEEVSTAALSDFSCCAKIIRGEYETDAIIVKNGGAITFSVTAPEEISGLKITKSDTGTRIEFENSDISEEIALPERTPFSLFCNMLSTLSGTEDYILSTAGENTSAEGDLFVFSLRTADSTFVSVAFPEYETEFIFSEFVFSEKS